jgi:L-alanine-DL-glutamate epimerase-like enolase superfamily enzyme
MKDRPIITKIEITKMRWMMKDIGTDSTGLIPTYDPGSTYPSGGYALRMYTSVGIIGEFATRSDISDCAEYLLGRNALERESIYNDLKVFRRQSMGAVDGVLWDIAGKYYGASVSELLGGYRKKLPAYASSMNGGTTGGLSTPESYADFAEQCMEMGYKAFKIHPYPRYPIEDHVAAVHALGKRVGGKIDLTIDPFCYYETFADALKVCKACDEEGFFWIEDPYKDGGTSHFGHQKLKDFVKTPLLQGEKVRGLEERMSMVLSKATDFIRGEVHVDGITGTMKLAHAAEGAGIDVEIHGCGPAQRHAMSAIRNSNYYEMVWVHPDVECLQTPPAICKDGYRDGLDVIDEDGCVPVPEGPGLGVELDWDFIKKHRTDGAVWE